MNWKNRFYLWGVLIFTGYVAASTSLWLSDWFYELNFSLCALLYIPFLVGVLGTIAMSLYWGVITKHRRNDPDRYFAKVSRVINLDTQEIEKIIGELEKDGFTKNEYNQVIILQKRYDRPINSLLSHTKITAIKQTLTIILRIHSIDSQKKKFEVIFEFFIEPLSWSRFSMEQYQYEYMHNFFSKLAMLDRLKYYCSNKY